MSQENVSGIKTFIATTDLVAFRRVKLTAGGATNVEYAGAGEAYIGYTVTDVKLGNPIGVALKSTGRTFKAVAAEALAAGASLYGAANGKVQDTVAGSIQNTALEAATADGDVIEVLPV